MTLDMNAPIEKKPRLLGAVLLFAPKTYEVDITGLVSNTVAVRWMEDLRVELMRTHFPEFLGTNSQSFTVIVKTNLHYVLPIRYGDSIRGEVWVSNIARSRWEVAFEFVGSTGLETRIRASQIGAFICSRTGVPLPVPEPILRYALALQSNGASESVA
jgi:acyl-CoA thioester hydrolase